MSLRTILEVVALIAVVLSLLYSRNIGNGRYQLLIRHHEQGGYMLLDTRTGQCWLGWEGNKWSKSIEPVPDQ